MIELCFEYLSLRCIWLYVIVISRTSFRMNPHSIVCLNVMELLARSRHHIWSLSDSNMIRTHNHLVRKRTLNHLAKLAKWLSYFVSTYLCDKYDTYLYDMAPASSKELLDIQANYRVMRLVSDMITIYSQMHRTDKYSQHRSIIWPVGLNGRVFVYKLSGCGLESRCCHLINPSSWNLRYTLPKALKKSQGLYTYKHVEKQPSGGIFSKKCSENMHQIYRRPPMPKCDFNKVAKQRNWNHTSAWVFSFKFAAHFQNTFF